MIATPSAPVTQPIALFADRYGSQMERLSHQHKLFVVAVLSQRLGLNCLVEDAIDSLDPDALIPEHLCDALRQLEPCPRRKLIELMLYCTMTLLSDT